VGGHHFTTLLSRDIVSSINFDACVAIQQKPLYCFSQSFGPFNFINDRNLKMTKKILNSCELIFPRERNSYKELADFGVSPNKLVMTYESVISLNRLFSTYMPVSYRKKLVGIAIYATQHREKSRYETYVNCMAKFCDYVTTKGFDIQFFPMEMKNSEPDDRPMIRQIIDKVHQKASVHILDEDLSTDEHLKAVAECQLFVGHKTHSTIFALTTGTPLIGIAYHPKTIEFMKQYGLEEYSINDSDLTTDRLSDCFDRILPNLSVIGESCFKKSRMISESIKDDFMQILKQSDRV
jgi:polysaccharide pyruvyl transferase WcaK-like protein